LSLSAEPDRLRGQAALAGVRRSGDPMEQMRRIAFEVVLRACGFGSLAIFCVMIGMSFDPVMAFKAGGFLTTIMAGILIFKGYEARTKSYRKTEMWLYLPKDQRPSETYAQWASSTVMRETYLTFASWTAGVSIVMWVVVLVFSVIGAQTPLLPK
jgi:hypothetical protein